MYCPFCGEKLTQIARDPKKEIEALADASDDEWESRGYEGEPQDIDYSSVDMSQHWECHNTRCNLRSPCYFNLHHPFRGPNSKPGDSWSISWIK